MAETTSLDELLEAEKKFVKFYELIDVSDRRKFRHIFVDTLKRVTNGKAYLVPIVEDYQCCITITARIFGESVNMLLNQLAEPFNETYKGRGWYQKTVDTLSSTLHTLSSQLQFNSIGRIMVPPGFMQRSVQPGSKPVPLEKVRELMQIPLNIRKADTLLRCSTCFSLPDIIRNTTNPDEKREAKQQLMSHYDLVSRQRTVIETLNKMSRDLDVDLFTLHADAMSNRHTKVPNMPTKPKFIADAARIGLSLSTVQIAIPAGSNLFQNIEYSTVQSVWTHDASYNLSLILDALSKMPTVPARLFMVMDSCPNNKAFIFFSGVAMFLSRITKLEQVYLLYPLTGHTHSSVDAHFGVVSKALRNIDFRDPKQFNDALSSLPSVAQVANEVTIFDFTQLSDSIYKTPGMCSAGQLCLSKSSDGNVYWSSAKLVNSSALFATDSGESCFKLFKDHFKPAEFNPTIRVPTSGDIKPKLEELFSAGGNVFNNVNKFNFHESLSTHGASSFRKILSVINSKPNKVAVPSNRLLTDEQRHLSVVRFLEQHGYNTGRVPKDPKILSSQLV